LLLIDNGINPNENVYAEVGSAINELQANRWRWAFQTPGGPCTRAEHIERSRRCAALGRPG
jgi:hypothetical protein